jgi:hypothetical protein
VVSDQGSSGRKGELLLLARIGGSGHVATTSALPPTADVGIAWQSPTKPTFTGTRPNWLERNEP